MKKANPNFTVRDLMQAIEERRPKDAYKFKLILERILPALASKDQNAVPPTAALLQDPSWDIPATHLQECLDEKGKWAPWLTEKLPELESSKSLRDDYRRCFARCLDHAIASRLISSSTVGVAPAWQEARELLNQQLPCTTKTLQALLQSGTWDLFGHSLTGKPPKNTCKFFRTILDSTNQLGRYMTSIGVMSPQEVRPEHLYGTDVSWYAYYRRNWPTGMTGVTRSRYGWDILKALRPEWALIDWPRPSEDRVFATVEEEWPPLFRFLLEDIEQLIQKEELSRATMENIRHNLSRLLGYLEKQLGIDVHALCTSLQTPEDLAWLLLGGYPPIEQDRELPPAQEVQRIIGDSAYRDDVLDRIQRANRRHESQGPCRPNPVLTLYLDWTLGRERTGSADVLLKTFRIVGQRYLRINDSQLGWMKKMIQRTKKVKAARPPSARSKRKQVVSLDPDLWLKLIKARPRLTAYTEEMNQAMNQATDPRSISYWKLRYAIAVRDELMLGILLAFQLRTENILRMKIGHEIIPSEYRIDVPGHRAKARIRIVKHFPDSGPFADLKALLDTYIEVARPILLAGRRETPYLFLSAKKDKEVFDDDGYLTVSKDRLRVSVQKAVDRHFKDLLPPGLDLLSPHTYRDIFTRAIYNSGGEVLTAQALGNTPEVVRSNYLVLNRGHDTEVKAFLESLDVPKSQPKRKAANRKEFKEGLTKILASASTSLEVTPQIIHAIMAQFDRNA